MKNAKLIIGIAVGVVAVVAIVLAIALSGGSHTHEFGEWDVTEKPTCSEEGTKVRYCDCGEKETEMIATLDHNYVNGECTNCGDIKEIPECKHGNVEVLAAKAPTCTEQGLTEGKKCTDCGEILLAQTETAMLSHTFGDWATVKAPTVTEEGLKERTCVCGEKDTVIVEKLIASEGLEYELNEDGQGYTVTGIGTCTDTDIVIPAIYNDKPVTAIGFAAFLDIDSESGDILPSYITSIVIPDSVVSIGEGAFACCSNLVSIVIPDSVTSIDLAVFAGCSGLTSIAVEEGNIKYHSVGNCLIETKSKTLIQGCKTSIIPNDGSVTSIGDCAFQLCTELTSIVIGDSVTSIGDYAFDGCTGLTSIVIGDSVTSIGDYAFWDCTGLTSIVIPDSVTSIGEDAFDGCTGLTSIVIGDSVTSIGDYAFSGCTGLTSIVIGNSVTSIGDYTFGWCSSLTSIVIPDSMTSIGDVAFYGCTGLTSIVIPDSVTSIGWGAFLACAGITDVYYTGTEAEWAKISIDLNNWDLTDATRHYNYVPEN